MTISESGPTFTVGDRVRLTKDIVIKAYNTVLRPGDEGVLITARPNECPAVRFDNFEYSVWVDYDSLEHATSKSPNSVHASSDIEQYHKDRINMSIPFKYLVWDYGYGDRIQAEASTLKVGDRVRLKEEFVILGFSYLKTILRNGQEGTVVSARMGECPSVKFDDLGYVVWVDAQRLEHATSHASRISDETITISNPGGSIRISAPISDTIAPVEEIPATIPVAKSPERDHSLHKVGQGFVSNDDIWAAVKAFGDG